MSLCNAAVGMAAICTAQRLAVADHALIRTPGTGDFR